MSNFVSRLQQIPDMGACLGVRDPRGMVWVSFVELDNRTYTRVRDSVDNPNRIKYYQGKLDSHRAADMFHHDK